MIPKKIKLKNAIGIKAGLRRDELEIDLEQIPEDAKMVAIRGDNGSGKSTLLNLAFTPWREPPPIRGTLYNEFDEGDGLRELQWEHAGRQLLTRIEIKKSGRTQATKSYLYMQDLDGEWQPFRTESNIISDGKNKTYDQCLEYVLGPKSLYFLSAFRAQGASTLAEHDDPKGLMQDLLGLEAISDSSKKAGDIARELYRHYNSEQAKLGDIADQEQQAESLDKELGEMEENLFPSLKEEIKKTEVLTANARAKYEAAKAATEENELARKALANLDAQLERLERDAKEKTSEIARETQKRTSQLRKNDIEIASYNLGCQEKLKATHARIERLKGLIADKPLIEEAEIMLKSVDENIGIARQLLDELRSSDTKRKECLHERQMQEQQLLTTGNDGKRLRQRYQEIVNRSRFVTVVPCRGEPPYDKCPALKEAMEAAGKIEAVSEELESMRGKYREIERSITDIAKKIGEPVDVKESEITLNKLLAEKTDATKIAARRQELANAEESLALAVAQLGDITQDIQQKGKERAAADAQLTNEIRELDRKRDSINQKLAQDRTEIARKKEEIGPLAPEDAVESAMKDWDAARQLHSTAQENIANLLNDISGKKGTLSALKQQIENRQGDKARLEELSKEISQWKLLKVALNGVIDLTIEDAGPSIAKVANQLLRDAYGPRFTVVIVTQRDTKTTGVTKEVFDIAVIDSETGIESSLLDKSGGESVWINKALCDAVAIHHQEVVGMQYGACFGDEVEDGLTAERKKLFYQMERNALERGGYKRKFFVSHDLHAWEIADWVIDVDEMRAH